ncbi:MAG: PD-(D/E)XK nuclease family protein [Gaiellaceae bacterium]
MPLSLLVGPANAGKVEQLLERFRDEIERRPFLVVPNVGDIERSQRDLLRRSPALLSGRVGTFDDLFRELAAGAPGRCRLGDSERRFVVRSLLAEAKLDSFARSARFGGFLDALVEGFVELESALIEPTKVEGELGSLYSLYLAELERLDRADRELERWLVTDRLAGELDGWPSERPLFVYGFEDLSGAQWRLLDALAARAEVTVALPYEPGRAAFAALARTQEELARRAPGRITELPPRSGEYAAPALAFVERNLFEPGAATASPTDGAIRFLEASGARAAFELVAEEALALLREGVEAEEIAVVCPSLERQRAPLETAFSGFGLPYVLEGRVRLGQIPFGHALCGLLRFVWAEGERRDLFSFLRSPYSELTRSSADFLEGRLRGRAVHTRARIESELASLRGGQQIGDLEALAEAASPLEAVRGLLPLMLRRAYGLENPPVAERARLDLRAADSVRSLLEELDDWQELSDRTVSREDLLAALERSPVRLGSAGEPGRVVISDLLQVRARRFRVVFLLGLEEGTFPRRASRQQLLGEEARERLEAHAAAPPPADELEHDRFLFYNACTRAYERLYLVRESANEEGSPRQASPFWEELRELFDSADVERWTKRRSLSKLVWEEVGAAPSERERLRSLVALASSELPRARALARANGWERQLERALGAFERPTVLRNPAVLEEFRARTTFSVTELEAFGGCSAMWLVERIVSPREIDGEVDAKLRGLVAHQVLYRFYSGLPKRLGTEKVEPDKLDRALEFLGECLSEAITSQVRLELDELERRELEAGLQRDLEHFVRSEAVSPLPLVPRRFEIAFGTERSAAELRRGLDLGGFSLSGKIDRIDLDPFAARGLVQDYKSGKTAHSAAQIESELKLQLPLYVLVLRDLVGVEPLGGIYRALAGERPARGLLRLEAKEDGVPGFVTNDYLEEEPFWGKVEWAAASARDFVVRIRAGDVRHDPLGRELGPGSKNVCPSWCQLAPLCRVPRR